MTQSAIERARARWQAARESSWSSHGAGSPPSGPTGPSDGLESRIKRLEDDSKEMKAVIKKILVESAQIKGRLAAMPTSLQLFLAIVAVFVASGLLRWFGH